MYTKAYFLIFATIISGCSFSTPSESDAKIALEKVLEGEYTRFLKISSFKKVDGMNSESNSSYSMDFEAKIACVGNEGKYIDSGCCYEADKLWPIMGNDCQLWAKNGDVLEVSGNLILLKKESGWVMMQANAGPYSIPVYKGWNISAVESH